MKRFILVLILAQILTGCAALQQMQENIARAQAAQREADLAMARYYMTPEGQAHRLANQLAKERALELKQLADAFDPYFRSLFRGRR